LQHFFDTKTQRHEVFFVSRKARKGAKAQSGKYFQPHKPHKPFERVEDFQPLQPCSLMIGENTNIGRPKSPTF
jgi:hypothetical protein